MKTNSNIWQEQKKVGNREERAATFLQEMQLSNDESKNSISSMAESVECGEISSSSSKWGLGLDKLFVICLNCDNKKN